jgi:hypothetical protein
MIFLPQLVVQMRILILGEQSNPLHGLRDMKALRSVSFELSKQRWAMENDSSHRTVAYARNIFEEMPPLPDGRPREIRLVFDDGQTEVMSV